MAAPRVYIGNLDERITERELEDEFRRYGKIRNIWVARKPPGFAFIDFEDSRDAEDAVRKLDGHQGWRVEISRRPDRGPGGGRGGGRGGGEDRFGGGDRGGDRRGPPAAGREMSRCFECGEVGHLARDCRLRKYGDPARRDRSRSPPARRERSPSRSRSPPPRRERSPPPRRSRSRS